jgi:outer membrane protein assembly factor BamB
LKRPNKVLENEIAGRILAQKGIIIVGVVVFVLAFAASFATVNYLDKFDVQFGLAENTSQPVDEGIEIIEVGKVQTDSLLTAQSEVASDSLIAPTTAAEETAAAKRKQVKPQLL